jgi:peptidyl-prolyl cis-trans isomerase SurA
MTKGQLSSWQKQQRRQKLVFRIGVSIVSVVMALVLVGIVSQWLIPDYLPMQKVVLEVNGEKVKTSRLIDMLRFYSGGYSEYVSMFVDSSLENIKQHILIEQYAAELDLVVSDKEVKEKIKEEGFEETNDAIIGLIRSQLLVERLDAEYFEPQIERVQLHRHVFAMFLESEDQVGEMKTKIEAGEDFNQLAAQYSLDSKTANQSGDIQFLPKGVIDSLLNTTGLDDYVFSVELENASGPFSDPEKNKSVGYWIIQIIDKNIENGEMAVHVQVMLLGNETDAQNARLRIEKGEAFDVVAKESSQLPDVETNGGDLGFINTGEISAAVDSFVFAEENSIGVLSHPLRDESQTTKGGYWLVFVPTEEERQISDDHFKQLADQIRSDWLTEIKENPSNEIVYSFDEELREYVIRKVLEE